MDRFRKGKEDGEKQKREYEVLGKMGQGMLTIYKAKKIWKLR